MTHPTLIVSLVSNALDPILSAAATAQKALYQRVTSMAHLLKSLESTVEVQRVAVVALSQLALPGVSPRDSVRRLVRSAPDARFILVADAAQYLFPADRAWLEVAPNVTLHCALNAQTFQQSGGQFLAAMFGAGDYASALRRMAPFLKALDTHAAPSAIDLALSKGVDYIEAARALLSDLGVAVANRRYHLTTYPDVFIASEACAWMRRALKVSDANALLAGKAMQEAGLIYHVVREKPFADEALFFRAAQYPADFSWADFLASFFSKDGPARKDRSYHGKTYPLCLQGQEVFDWMRAKGLSENHAMTLGQRMIDLHIIHHVADEQPFRAANLFFRARHDEVPNSPAHEIAPPQFKLA